MKSNYRLYKIFFIQVAVFIISLISVTFIVFYFLSISQTERRVVSDFHSEMLLIEEDLEHQIILAIESVKAMSSRTMIRKYLYSYHNNEISLNELREYTQSKYVDGASVYSNIVTAVRTTVDGDPVAEFKTRDLRMSSNDESKTVKIINENGAYYLMIRNEIIHEQILIGHDIVVFDFNNALSINPNFIDKIQLCETGLNYSGEEQKLSIPIGDYGCFLYGELKTDYLDSEKHKQMKTVIIFSLILFISILIISYFTILRSTAVMISEKDKKNRQLSQLLTERKTLFKEMNHRIKNNLNLINSFIRFELNSDDSERTKRRFSSLQSRINAVSLIHEQLQDKEEIIDIEIRSYLKQLGQRVLDANHAENFVFHFQQGNAISIKSDIAIPVGLITSEFITNSLKHAVTEKDLNIWIELNQIEDGLQLLYCDDGLPYPENFSLSSSDSLGGNLIVSLCNQLRAALRYDFNESKEIMITIPV